MSDTHTLIRLKYEVITSDRNTWHFLDTYPKEVKLKWAWRCVADVEHLAKKHAEAKKCIQMAKDFRDRKVALKELNAAHSTALLSVREYVGPTGEAMRDATIAANAAASIAYHRDDILVARSVAGIVSNVANIALGGTTTTTKWNQYIEWLVEELIAYEERAICE